MRVRRDMGVDCVGVKATRKIIIIIIINCTYHGIS